MVVVRTGHQSVVPTSSPCLPFGKSGRIAGDVPRRVSAGKKLGGARSVPSPERPSRWSRERKAGRNNSAGLIERQTASVCFVDDLYCSLPASRWPWTASFLFFPSRPYVAGPKAGCAPLTTASTGPSRLPADRPPWLEGKKNGNYRHQIPSHPFLGQPQTAQPVSPAFRIPKGSKTCLWRTLGTRAREPTEIQPWFQPCSSSITIGSVPFTFLSGEMSRTDPTVSSSFCFRSTDRQGVERSSRMTAWDGHELLSCSCWLRNVEKDRRCLSLSNSSSLPP